MCSLRWHFTNKSVTGAPYSTKGYSYSLSHSRTLWWRVVVAVMRRLFVDCRQTKSRHQSPVRRHSPVFTRRAPAGVVLSANQTPTPVAAHWPTRTATAIIGCRETVTTATWLLWQLGPTTTAAHVELTLCRHFRSETRRRRVSEPHGWNDTSVFYSVVQKILDPCYIFT